MRRAMLCPECNELVAVKKIDQSNAHLACGHARTKGLLPAKGISIEHLDTPDGLRLFPPDLSGVRR
jgi:hypothetical protein